MSPKELSDIRRKLRVIQHGQESGNVSKTCRYFGVSRETYYKWKKDYESEGERALVNSKPCPENPKLRIAAEIEAQIIHLRTTYHLGQLRISWYMKRYHDIAVSPAGVYNVLKRNGPNKLPQNQRKRSMEQFKRYESGCLAIGSRSMLNSYLLLISPLGRKLNASNTQQLMMQQEPGH